MNISFLRITHLSLISIAMLALAGCGSGGGYGGGGGGGTTYSVGGVVSGLTGSGLVLRDNGGNDLAVSMSGSFTFANKVANGATHGVTVYAQPTSPVQSRTVSSQTEPEVAQSPPRTSLPWRLFAPMLDALRTPQIRNGISISVYTIDLTTGALALVAGSPFAAGNAPSSVVVSK